MDGVADRASVDGDSQMGCAGISGILLDWHNRVFRGVCLLLVAASRRRDGR